MRRLSVPPNMPQFSMWAFWGVSVVGASLWVFFGLFGYFRKAGWVPEDASGWAQAFGAILGIAGAGTFPYWHEHVKEKKNQERTTELLSAVARHLANELTLINSMLSGSMIKKPEFAHEIRMHARPKTPNIPKQSASPEFLEELKLHTDNYVVAGHASKWTVYRSLLADISAAHLWSGSLLHHLFHLKTAAEAGHLVSSEIDRVTESPQVYAARLQLVQYHIQNVHLAITYLEKK